MSPELEKSLTKWRRIPNKVRSNDTVYNKKNFIKFMLVFLFLVSFIGSIIFDFIYFQIYLDSEKEIVEKEIIEEEIVEEEIVEKEIVENELEGYDKNVYHIRNMYIAIMVFVFLIIFFIVIEDEDSAMLLLIGLLLIGLLFTTVALFVYKILHIIKNWNWNHEDKKIRDSFRASFVGSSLFILFFVIPLFFVIIYSL